MSSHWNRITQDIFKCIRYWSLIGRKESLVFQNLCGYLVLPPVRTLHHNHFSATGKKSWTWTHFSAFKKVQPSWLTSQTQAVWPVFPSATQSCEMLYKLLLCSFNISTEGIVLMAAWILAHQGLTLCSCRKLTRTTSGNSFCLHGTRSQPLL